MFLALFSNSAEDGTRHHVQGSREVSLRDQFAQGFMDGDLLHVITTSVPPADIKAIGSFRTDFVVGFLCNMSFV